MDPIEELVKRLETMSHEFQYLIQENQKLKSQIKAMKNQQDLMTRDSQDMILTIKNKLQKENTSE